MRVQGDVDLLKKGQILNARLQNVTTAQAEALAAELGPGHAGLAVYDVERDVPLLWEGDAWNEVRKIRYFTAIADKSGIWRINYTGTFTRVDMVTPVAVHNASGAANQATASLNDFNTREAFGMAYYPQGSNSLFGGDKITGANVVVRVRVEGI